MYNSAASASKRPHSDGTPLAHPLDLPELSWAVALRGNIIVTAAAGTSASTSQGLHAPYEIASCSAAPADRHDHRIMAGYPVHRPTSSPVLTREAAHRVRDSVTLSGKWWVPPMCRSHR